MGNWGLGGRRCEVCPEVIIGVVIWVLVLVLVVVVLVVGELMERLRWVRGEVGVVLGEMKLMRLVVGSTAAEAAGALDRVRRSRVGR